MSINKEKLKDVENGFKELKANSSSISGARTIADALSSITNKTIKVVVIQPTSVNKDCVVMSVFPDVSTTDRVIRYITSEEKDSLIASAWQGCNSWTVEIDARILNRDMDLTERELTAFILHEMGHVIYSFSIPQRISEIVRLKFATSRFLTKQLLKDNLFSRLLCFPVLHACSATNHGMDKKALANEINADNFAVKAGYKKDLASAMDKLIIYAGKDHGSKTIEDLSDFSIDSMIGLMQRQNKLVRKNLIKLESTNASPYIGEYITKLYNSFTGVEGTNVNEHAKDEFIDKRITNISEAAYITEGIFGPKRMKRIDPADIDYIGLEVENIKTNDDKMMIISYIYNKMDIIDYYIGLLDCKSNKYLIPHTRESLINMKKQLEEYRVAALRFKLPKIEYGISIQYPEGYEG